MLRQEAIQETTLPVQVCDTLFYQGIGCSQTQAVKYTYDQQVVASTGEKMWCTGRNNLLPIKVIYKLHIGCETSDVNLNPFKSYKDYFNPVNLVGASISWLTNWSSGIHVEPIKGNAESVVFHAPILSQISIGQTTDIESHKKKYEAWLKRTDKTSGLVLWGVSRGTAATFCAFAKEKYPEVRLVVLEGAIDSVQQIVVNRAATLFKNKTVANYAGSIVNNSFALLNKWKVFQYSASNISPLACVNDFPENIPVVFITSKVDEIVPCENTKRIATALAAQGKNDVYLLQLERSSHRYYMFDDKTDRDCYEAFIHAIYAKYGLQHDEALAAKGRHLLAECLLPMNRAQTFNEYAEQEMETVTNANCLKC